MKRFKRFKEKLFKIVAPCFFRRAGALLHTYVIYFRPFSESMRFRRIFTP
jgi:hypothetical protein